MDFFFFFFLIGGEKRQLGSVHLQFPTERRSCLGGNLKLSIIFIVNMVLRGTYGYLS